MQGRVWLTAMAAALGVSEAACNRDASHGPAAARDVPSSSSTLGQVASSATPSATPAIASVGLTPSSSALVANPAPSASVVTSVLGSAAPQDIASALVGEPGITGVLRSNNSCGATVGQMNRPGLGNLHNGACGASAICGARRQPTGPTAIIQTTLAGASAGDERVIAMNKGRLRMCANQALKQDPTQQGKLVVTVAVAASGEVSSASVASNVGLSAQSAACMSATLRRVTFPAGSARTFTLAIVQTKDGS